MDSQLSKQQLDALLHSLDPEKIDRYASEPSVLEAQIVASATRIAGAKTSPSGGVADVETWLNAMSEEARHAVDATRKVHSGGGALDAETVCRMLLLYCSVLSTLDVVRAKVIREGAKWRDRHNHADTLASDAREIVANCGRLLGGTALMEFLLKQRRSESNEPANESLEIVWGLMSVLGVKFAPRLCRIVEG